MYPQELALTTENRVRGLIEIRDCVRELINLQLYDYPEEDIKREQEKLNDLYDKFIKKYGLINSRGNSTAFSNDSSYFLLCSLEILDENKELKRTVHRPFFFYYTANITWTKSKYNCEAK